MRNGILTQELAGSVRLSVSSAKTVLSLRISTIVHATEDPGKVDRAIRNLCQLDGSIQPFANRVKGHYGNQITSLVLTVKNSKAAENCLKDIWTRLSVLDRDAVHSSLTSRVDNSGTLFLRVDKQGAFKGTIRLQDTDPIKLGISFKSLGMKHHEIINTIQKMLTGITSSAVESH